MWSCKLTLKHIFFPLLTILQVYCNNCYQNRSTASKPQSTVSFQEKSKSSSARGKSTTALICAVEDCESEVKNKDKWVDDIYFLPGVRGGALKLRGKWKLDTMHLHIRSMSRLRRHGVSKLARRHISSSSAISMCCVLVTKHVLATEQNVFGQRTSKCPAKFRAF